MPHTGAEAGYDLVLMSYISGSVSEGAIGGLYANAYRALRPGGRLLIHDFMVRAVQKQDGKSAHRRRARRYARPLSPSVPSQRNRPHVTVAQVDDGLDGPRLGALWALQHVTVNVDGLGLSPAELTRRLLDAGFEACETDEMIHGMTKLIIAHKK